MTDDENPWYSDADSGVTPPTVPDGGARPATPPPQQFAPQQHPPQQHPPQQFAPQTPPGYQAYGQPGFGPAAQSNSKATTSMVLGIVGLASIVFCYGVLCIVLGPLSFFMGRSAQKEMALAPNAWSNQGMAKAGWIMGLIQSIVAVLLIIGVVALVIWLSTAQPSNF